MLSTCLDKIQATDEEKVGVRIVRRAMEEPARRIFTDTSQDGSVIVVRSELETFLGRAQPSGRSVPKFV